MTVEQKVRIAMQLEALGVDVIEAGFPVISDGDFQAVRTVAERTESSRVCGLARCVEKDILAVHEAVSPAGDPGAHPPRSGDFPHSPPVQDEQEPRGNSGDGRQGRLPGRGAVPGSAVFRGRTPPARNPIFWRRWWKPSLTREPPSSTSRIRWGTRCRMNSTA